MKNQIYILTILLALCLVSCCPEIQQQETVFTKKLIDVRSDTVYVDRFVPKVEITDESSTFVAMPSIETIDTVLTAKNTLRKYMLKVIRNTKPVNIIENRKIKTVLKPEYEVEVVPEKPDSLYVRTVTINKQVVKGRAWYEVPLFIAVSLIAFILGLFIGRKLL